MLTWAISQKASASLATAETARTTTGGGRGRSCISGATATTSCTDVRAASKYLQQLISKLKEYDDKKDACLLHIS